MCAVLSYAEDTLAQTPPEQKAQNPMGVARFEKLIADMRATKIHCPPKDKEVK